MSIKIFVTGGTFEKEYNPKTQSLILEDTHVPEILDHSRTSVDVSIEKLMLIDSLEMTDSDREDIVNKCKRAPEDKILITHGTDTMVQTAAYIAERIKDKTIILTGAMYPYKLVDSDASFNLGSALAFVQLLPHGIYIVMNGRYYNWNNCQKNHDKGRFEEVR